MEQEQTLIVDHICALEVLIRRAKFNRVSAIYQNDSLFPEENQGLVIVETEIVPAPFHHVTTSQALDCLRSKELRPATVREILALADENEGLLPDIIALGSIFSLEEDLFEAPAIASDGTGRLLAAGYTNGTWSMTTSFLGVKKGSERKIVCDLTKLDLENGLGKDVKDAIMRGELG
jgi:hypothetical protein